MRYGVVWLDKEDAEPARYVVNTGGEWEGKAVVIQKIPIRSSL
ncbi:hypothetical protein [Lonsdalea britannica]|nr:hypothetical protein [Lonsdalea britannica]